MTFPQSQYRRAGIAWLELLLAIAAVVLLLQLFPGVAMAVVAVLDVRTWTSWGWFAACAVFCVALCVIRYGPDVAEGFAVQHQEAAAERAKRKRLHEAEVERQRKVEERALYERMKEARKRQA